MISNYNFDWFWSLLLHCPYFSTKSPALAQVWEIRYSFHTGLLHSWTVFVQSSYWQQKCNIIIVFFTNLMHKFFILIHSLHPSTCFKHYCVHPQEVKFVLLQHPVSSLSLGDCSVHRLRKDCSTVLSKPTEQSPKQSDETRCCTNTIWPPEDEHNSARNTQRDVISVLK